MALELIQWQNDETVLNEDTMNKFQNNIKNAINDITAGMPIGSGMDYYGTTVPKNYLFADGSAISRTEYAELYGIIGTTYGAGDGSTTFNLPDKRERVSVMRKEDSTNGTTGATMGTLGAKGGEFKHTMTIDDLVPHNHPVKANMRVASGGMYRDNIFENLSNNSNPFSLTCENTGKGEPFNVCQPYLVCNYIIKVK